MHETRERIVRAAFELHRDAGPAQATIRAIAERAGVERHTVYRHFPDLVELIRACTDFGMRTTGLPEPDDWTRITDPVERLRTALREMYRYWRANERLVANLMRDAPAMPALVQGSASYREHLGRIWDTVVGCWSSVSGERGVRARALAATALEFETWRSLTGRHGLADEDAVESMVIAVRSVASADHLASSGEPDPGRRPLRATPRAYNRPVDEADLRVRNATYQRFVELGRAPTAAEVASAVGAEEDAVRTAWRRLHDAHALVLDDGGELRMANPFAARPTDFRVTAAGRDWYANCAWDAFGIGAALHVDSELDSHCPDCHEPLHIRVRDGRPDDTDLVFHVLVPAAKWWNDIGFT